VDILHRLQDNAATFSGIYLCHYTDLTHVGAAGQKHPKRVI